MDGGIYTPDTDIYEAIDDYVSDAKEQSTATFRERSRILQKYFPIIIEEHNIETVEDLHPDHIKKYRNLRREEGVSDLTINNEINYIQGLARNYNYYEFLQYFDRSELNLDTQTNIEKSDEDIPSITKDEYKLLLDECNSLRDELIVRIGVETGVRRSEMAGIRISDIDDDEITIRSAKSQSNEKRPVFVDFTTESKIQKYIDTERKSYKNYSQTDKLFLTQRGEMHPHTVNNIVVRKAKEAGIQSVIGEDSRGNKLHRVTAHSLRHTFALWRLDNDMSIKYIADLMGDTVQTVSETYLQTDKDTLREANKRHRPTISY